MIDFESISHTADFKIKAYGSSIAQLFINALKGMFQMAQPIMKDCAMVDDRIVCKKWSVQRSISVQAYDHESLLVAFLSQALCLADSYNEAYLDATINQLSDTSLTAIVHGNPIQGFSRVEIKAVTYHELAIEKIGEQWQATIIFDI